MGPRRMRFRPQPSSFNFKVTPQLQRIEHTVAPITKILKSRVVGFVTDAAASDWRPIPLFLFGAFACAILVLKANSDCSSKARLAIDRLKIAVRMQTRMLCTQESCSSSTSAHKDGAGSTACDHQLGIEMSEIDSRVREPCTSQGSFPSSSLRDLFHFPCDTPLLDEMHPPL